MLRRTMSRAVLLCVLTVAPVVAAAPTLPSPVQSLLQQIKGEWVLLDQELGVMYTRVNLQADGRGTLVNGGGESEITWRLEAGQIKINLLKPTVTSSIVYENDANGEPLEYTLLTSLQSMTLQYKKLEGLTNVIWKVVQTATTSYENHPEKETVQAETTAESVRLIPGRQFKNFAPRVGDVASLGLADFNFTYPSILVRFDAANVLTIVGGQPIGVDHLFWTLDKGTLRVSDGNGYTISFKSWKTNEVASHVLADIVNAGKHTITDNESVKIDAAIRAQGFHPDSPLLNACAINFVSTTTCFQNDRVWSSTFSFGTGEKSSIFGLWQLEDGKIQVTRYRDSEGNQVSSRQGLLDCESKAAACTVYSTRSYEVVNQSEERLGVYRVTTYESGYVEHVAHSFTLKK